MPRTIRTARRPALLALLTAAVAGLAAAVTPPQSPPEKPRLAIRQIAATPAVTSQARSEGAADALAQVEQGADSQLMDAINATRRFDLVARSDMPSVTKEQDLTQSGNVNVMDPQAARAFQLAGARYVATVTIGNFQDISERTELLNQFGTSKAERRTIDLQATVKIFDTTTGTLFRSTTVTISEAATNEIMPGVEQKGSKTNVVLGQAAARLAREAAANIADSISPARVVGYTMGKITFNRSADQGVADGPDLGSARARAADGRSRHRRGAWSGGGSGRMGACHQRRTAVLHCAGHRGLRNRPRFDHAASSRGAARGC